MHDERNEAAATFLDAVREVAGEAGVQAVRLARGGTRTSCSPIIRSDDDWLAKALGRQSAEKVAAQIRIIDADGRAMGLEDFYLPRAGLGRLQLFKAALMAEATRMLDDGQSVREVARFTGLGERAIWRLKRARKAIAANPAAPQPEATLHIVTPPIAPYGSPRFRARSVAA